MAKRKVAPSGDQNDMDLEQIDVELRNPSVVLSVRLDGDTAKALHQLARKRGERVSEALREAVVAWVASAAAEAEPVYRATYLNKVVAVSSHSVQNRGTWATATPVRVWPTRGNLADLVGRRTTALANRLGATAPAWQPNVNPDLQFVRTGRFRQDKNG